MWRSSSSPGNPARLVDPSSHFTEVVILSCVEIFKGTPPASQKPEFSARTRQKCETSLVAFHVLSGDCEIGNLTRHTTSHNQRHLARTYLHTSKDSHGGYLNCFLYLCLMAVLSYLPSHKLLSASFCSTFQYLALIIIILELIYSEPETVQISPFSILA